MAAGYWVNSMRRVEAAGVAGVLGGSVVTGAFGVSGVTGVLVFPVVPVFPSPPSVLLKTRMDVMPLVLMRIRMTPRAWVFPL